jgi:2,4-dienoyl-CoA reductase (NADPH2)
MGSMHVGLEGGPGGEAALLQFYKERSGHDGPALMITGGISVSHEGEGGPHFLGFYRDKDLSLMSRLTREIHNSGGKMAAQLFHAGRYSYPELTGIPAVAPSALRSPIHRTTPEVLTELQIEQLILAFAYSAKKAREVGFDAVEVMGSEGYLLNQFLSPATNQREDQWGGNFENRARFPLEVLKAVRKEVGDDYPILFRLSGADLVPNSTTEEETIQFSKLVELYGADAINVGIGWHESTVPTISMMVPRAAFMTITEKIKHATKIPVVGSNRINDPRLAEELLQNGACDLISMARPFLADPDLLRKARKEQFDSINTCIACNQACLDHAFEGKPVSCLVNPRTGRESIWHRHLEEESRLERIAVVGGGAGGMEAARALAEKGHKVILYEAKEFLGGQLNYAKKVPGKQEFYETIRYYTHQLKQLKIDIRLSTSPTEDDLLADKVDHVVIATGVRPRLPNIPGIDLPNVYTYQQVLSGQARIGQRIAIIGAGGIGCDTAHFLLGQNISTIFLLRRKGKMGEGLGKTTRWASVSHLLNKGIQFLTNLHYVEIMGDGIVIEEEIEGELVNRKIPIDTVIIAAGQESQTWQYSKLLQYGVKVNIIGGARHPGELDAKRAIYEGARLAFEPSS